MINAFAPGMRRGFSWVWLSIALTGLVPASALGQGPKSSPAPTKEKDAKTKTESTPPFPEVADAKPSTGTLEVFKDPRAEEALEKLKSVPGLRPPKPKDVTDVKAMAAASMSVDRDTIQRFVEGMAYNLLDRASINSFLNVNPNPKPALGIKDSTNNLIEAINTAKAAKNTSFLSTYIPIVVATLQKLLDNHLVSRIEAMIVLGQTGSPDAVPIFQAQLKDPKQTVWVKHWAARGLYNVVDGGTRVDAALGGDKPVVAAKVLADYLGSDEEIPWPTQVRVLEALGAMRQAAVQNNQQKIEMAAAAMKLLADPDAKPEVRAAAACALGMMRVNSAVNKYNYKLIVYHIGQLSAELGEKIRAVYAKNPTLAEYWAGLLVSQIYQAFNGIDGARESGLLHATHPNFAASQAFTKQVADLESGVARAAIELVRAPTGLKKGLADVLSERVAALKSYLEKNPPQDFHLVPEGNEYRLGSGQVAELPGGKPRRAGAPGAN